YGPDTADTIRRSALYTSTVFLKRARRQLRDGRRDVAEAASVIDAGAAHETHRVANLVRDDAPAVDLLLVDPAGTVEGRANQCRGHRRVPGDHERPFYAGCARAA